MDTHTKYSNRDFCLHELRAAIPAHLFHQHTMKSLFFLLRDLIMASSLALLVIFADNTLVLWGGSTIAGHILRVAIWLAYWWFQGLIFTGIWVIGHECGHGAFSRSRLFSDSVGFLCHTALWTPYFSWKITHQSHHRHHASMEKDEHWVPKTRSELRKKKEDNDYFEDTPIIAVFYLVIQQLLGFPAYLILNASGQPKPYTSHFNPFSSSLFKPSQRKQVIISDFGILLMGYIVYLWCRIIGIYPVLRLYGLPCIATSHWITMIVFLQHTDPRLPHYRKSAWTFQRGALSTMDRDFLGWQGRFFLHDIAHFHTIHHLFPTIPFYHAEEATAILKRIFPEEYQSSTEPVFKCLWENFHKCQFVEDEDEILYYKDKQGRNLILD